MNKDIMKIIRKKCVVIAGIMGMAFLMGCQKTSMEAAKEMTLESPVGNMVESTEETTEEITEEITEETTKGLATMKETMEQPQTVSLEYFLKTAMMPLGTTLYIWGGGWNEEDTGAGAEALSKGLSPAWREFYESQGPEYNNMDYEYQIHKGLDCSGYIGWLMYNVFEEQYSTDGYVMKASIMAKTFADWGMGNYQKANEVSDWLAGDIMSKSDHVWISLGTCEDGSVLLIHSSQPGVRICGTQNADGSESQAMKLAKDYTMRYYPDWHEKYPDYGVGLSYLQQSAQMRWNESTFYDAPKFQAMKPDEVLEYIFEEQ